MAICDEENDQLFALGVVVKQLLQFYEDRVKVCSTTSANVLDSGLVLIESVISAHKSLRVVGHGVELLEGALLCLVVCFANDFSSELQGINGCARHRARDI